MERRESGFKRSGGMTNLLLESCGNFRSGEVRAFFQLPLQMDTRASVLYSTNVYVAE